ncbi:MAG: dTMP kinase [Actinobacteria bacterium]|nr:dTMP kinase [Actinomycetota bacterium]
MFITFEGIDGSGKTTQIELLKNFLQSLSIEAVITREPGGTDVGDRIRDILLDPQNQNLCPRAETLLFEAARAELTDKVIIPNIEKGSIIICDRFFDSTLAYQGIARGLGVKKILDLSLWATRGIAPDITFLLTLEISDSEKRMNAQMKKRDRIEHEKDEFKIKLMKGYIALAKMFKDRIILIDAKDSVKNISGIIQEHTIKLLKKRGLLPVAAK